MAGTFRDASVASYHANLRGFLDNAGSMANVAKSFLSDRGAFPSGSFTQAWPNIRDVCELGIDHGQISSEISGRYAMEL